MDSGKWIPADIAPEKEDCYIIAWLPNGYDKKECFYAIAEYNAFDGWNTSDLKKILEDFWEGYTEVEVYAWRELPEPYIRKE